MKLTQRTKTSAIVSFVLTPASLLIIMLGIFIASRVLEHETPAEAQAKAVCDGDKIFLRVRNWETGEILVSEPASVGGELYFGWIHSQERIPWNEYYRIDENLDLILDRVTFPAFGAGIPENKGRLCHIENGVIHMEGIGERFAGLDWLNSNTATRDITLDGAPVTRGELLPHHVRLSLFIERGESDE